MRSPNTERLTNAGFTLVEMAIVLMIVALLLGGLLPTISSQVEQRHENDTRKQLDEIQQALIGFAVINGRLPCPATYPSPAVTDTHGQENPTNGSGTCAHAHDKYSFVPAVTLGLSGADSNGLIEDAWGNPIRYAVADGSSNAFTKSISGIGISSIGSSSIANLDVCSTASTIGSSCSVSGSTLTSNAVAVIYSTGKNGANGTGAGPDEQENPTGNSSDSDTVYVSHTPTPTFDDMVIWLSPNVLVNRMVSAGKLP
jgi:prepilin-type N-terminal cleavage/methylation domain-containing protein